MGRESKRPRGGRRNPVDRRMPSATPPRLYPELGSGRGPPRSGHRPDGRTELRCATRAGRTMPEWSAAERADPTRVEEMDLADTGREVPPMLVPGAGRWSSRTGTNEYPPAQGGSRRRLRDPRLHGAVPADAVLRGMRAVPRVWHERLTLRDIATIDAAGTDPGDGRRPEGTDGSRWPPRQVTASQGLPAHECLG